MGSQLLPPPEVFGFAGFESWRPHQSNAVEACLDTEYRVAALVAPTGSGKSLTYLTTAILKGKRAVILTSTKGLQSQLARDYSGIGLVDMRGRNNYLCRALNDGSGCDAAPCTLGLKCALQSGGCDYFDQLRRARQAPLVVTNYAFWMAIERHTPEGLGPRDMIVCDEAHNAPEAVASFLKVQFNYSNMEVAQVLPDDPRKLLDMTMQDWVDWAKAHLERLDKQLKNEAVRLKANDGGTKAARRAYNRLAAFVDGVARVATVEEPDLWVPTVDTKHTKVQLSPIWPGKDAERVLFLKRPVVILTSATVCRKTLDLLGITPDDSEILEYPHTFPLQSRLLIHVPTVRLNFRTTPAGLRTWVLRMDQIIGARRDRKGIVHTISYARRNFVLKHSKHATLMVTHETASAEPTVARFKSMAPPAVLVSPSMSTGWDFPYSECEYQIIGKIPYPDTTDKLTKARTRADKTYAAYIAMQELVQACGRGVRAPDDHCESFIIDDNATWFIPRNAEFAPGWFLEAFQQRSTIPRPPDAVYRKPTQNKE